MKVYQGFHLVIFEQSIESNSFANHQAHETATQKINMIVCTFAAAWLL
jgi:hypothetical protein